MYDNKDAIVLTLSQLLLIIVGFWLIITYLAGRFDFQKYNLFVSSGFLIWKSDRLRDFLSRPPSSRFQYFQKISVYMMLSVFYMLPVVFVINFARSYFAKPSPIFEGNPLQVFNIEVILLVLPAIFVVGSIYQIIRGKALTSSEEELESTGIILLGVILLFYSRSKAKLDGLSNKKQLKTIATPFLAILLFLMLMYPISTYSPEIMSTLYHDPTGALVVNVIPGTPADDKGLLPEDVITGIKTIDGGVIISEIPINSRVDLYSTLRTINPGDEFILVLNQDQINIAGIQPPENSPVVGGSYIGLDTVDYQKPRISLLSPLFPFMVTTVISWMINLTLLYALYNVLPIPMGDGERLLKIILGRITDSTIIFRLIQVLYLGLFIINFFLV